ncbi:hypothetical protein AAE478_000472 [Parahypoxylon ruwenzoriense]
MAPFALPVPGYRLGIHPRAGKRKRAGDGPDGGTASLSPEPDFDAFFPSSSHLPSDSINPLSHSPDTLRQFAIAGLQPDDELPSKRHPLFPHKRLPPDSSSGTRRRRGSLATQTDTEEEEAAATVTPKQYSERLKHLGTLTAIMHRCLADGDIARAKRAFGLLLHTRDVDIRAGGLWAVGSEILMRDGEKPREQQQFQATEDEDEDEDRPSGSRSAGGRGPAPRRWGSAANVERVRTYFENLIQQHPHDAHRPHLTSALDFWPALFGVEIYNLDAELRRALWRLRREQARQREQEQEDEEGDLEMDDYETAYAYDEESRRRRYQQEQEQQQQSRRLEVAAARDEVRRETWGAAGMVAARMDQVMENAPFATHRELLRLRGNLALFIADLYLPSRIIDFEPLSSSSSPDRGEESREVEHRMEDLSLSSRQDRLLRARADGAEEHRALDQRREEQDRARGFFRRIVDSGGEVDGWVRRFMGADEEEEEMHDASFEGEGVSS